MKRAFPGWLRRLDPQLAAEDTNPLFEAFRLRREEYRPALLQRLLRPRFRGTPPAYVVAIVLIVVLTLAAFMFCSCVALLIPLLGLPFLRRYFARQRISGGFLPHRLTEVFTTRGFFETAAVDIWLTGCAGRDVTEAIYLEHRQQQWKTHAGILIIFYVVPVVIYAYYAQILSFHGPLLLIAWTWLCWETFLATLVNGIEAVRSQKIEDLCEYWRGNLPAAQIFSRGIESSLFFLGALVGALIATLVVVLFSAAVVQATSANPREAYLAKHGVELGFAVYFLSLATIFRIIRGPMKRYWLSRCGDTMGTADLAYNQFMAGTVMGDPEGAAWARWRYGDYFRPFMANTPGGVMPPTAPLPGMPAPGAPPPPPPQTS